MPLKNSLIERGLFRSFASAWFSPILRIFQLLDGDLAFILLSNGPASQLPAVRREKRCGISLIVFSRISTLIRRTRIYMRVTLTVLSEGKVKGKEIAVRTFPFIIGRDPQCQLRPASALVSKRHCAVLVRDNKVFIHDFQSTNGTFVNGRQIMGDIEIRHDDQLTVGPLNFAVRVDTLPPVNRPTPPPPSKSKSEGAHDDEAAALLLAGLSEEPATTEAERATDSSGVPTGSTIDMEVPPGGAKPPAKAEPTKKTKEGEADTSKSAAAILEKYRRRPRQ